jgi:Flp pilus assembly protein TadD
MTKLVPALFLLLATAFGQAVNVADAYKKSFQYERNGDTRNAILALSEVSKAWPDGYTPNLRLGWLHFVAGNFADSLERYQKAVKAAPYSTEARVGQAAVLIFQKRWADAETLLLQVLTIDLYNYYGNLKLSYVLRMEKKPEQAEKVARKMLSLYPSDTAWLVELGWARWAQKDLSAATSLFTDVQILDPENLDAKAYFTPAAK